MSAFRHYRRGYCARCEKRMVQHRTEPLCWDCRIVVREQEERDAELERF